MGERISVSSEGGVILLISTRLVEDDTSDVPSDCIVSQLIAQLRPVITLSDFVDSFPVQHPKSTDGVTISRLSMESTTLEFFALDLPPWEDIASRLHAGLRSSLRPSATVKG